MLNFSCTWWLPPAHRLYSTHASSRMILLTSNGIVQLRKLNNKGRLLDHLTEKPRGRRTSGTVQSGLQLLFSVGPSVLSCLLALSLVWLHSWSKTTIGECLIPTITIPRAKGHPCPSIPNLFVELHTHWITSELVLSFLRNPYANEEEITWSNPCGGWR